MPSKIILILMVKNESRIIERCLTSALPIIDAVSVLDTGSTDDTVRIVDAFLKSSSIPYTITQEPFINFGKSRTRSFELAQKLCLDLKWDVSNTYGMAIDADMMVVPSSSFKSYPLTLNGYSVIQANGNLKYYNIRFMKLSYSWVCIGSTHEYWSGENTGKIPFDVFYIDDRNDGGCKSDKFERDVRLLTEEISNDPTNVRAHYYLGQSFKDLGRFDEAIPMFKRRIALGGWYEEVWYSYYQIGKCYEQKGNIHKMEQWMNKAFDFHPSRAEPLYHLCNYFRIHSDHYKAYHYYLKGRHIPYPKSDVLFIEDQVYNGLFEYENTILAYYVSRKMRYDGAREIIQYLNASTPYHEQNVWDNLHHYVESLCSDTYHGQYTSIQLPKQACYHASSCSIVPYSTTTNDKFLVNIRYVNYRINEDGGYTMPDGIVRTLNCFLFLNDQFERTSTLDVMYEDYQQYPSHIAGLEDVRLFRTSPDSPIFFTASSLDATPDDMIKMMLGQYDPVLRRMYDIKVIHGTQPVQHEKNWLFVPEKLLTSPCAKSRINMIYKWYPLEIGYIHPVTNHLHIHTTHQTPRFFSRLRGSASPVQYNDKLWVVVHYVRYSTPRIYYHCVVQLNIETMTPEQISIPFCFRRLAIEYCLGFHISDDGDATFLFSENDCNPGMMRIPIGSLKWIMLG